MPRHELIGKPVFSITNQRFPQEQYGSCDFPGCNKLFTLYLESGAYASCSRCKRLFCADHEEKVRITIDDDQDESDSSSSDEDREQTDNKHDDDPDDTDDDDGEESDCIGCLFCCTHSRYAHLRLFDDAEMLKYLLSVVIKSKTRLDVVAEMRKQLVNKDRPIVVGRQDGTTYSMPTTTSGSTAAIRNRVTNLSLFNSLLSE